MVLVHGLPRPFLRAVGLVLLGVALALLHFGWAVVICGAPNVTAAQIIASSLSARNMACFLMSQTTSWAFETRIGATLGICGTLVGCEFVRRARSKQYVDALVVVVCLPLGTNVQLK